MRIVKSNLMQIFYKKIKKIKYQEEDKEKGKLPHQIFLYIILTVMLQLIIILWMNFLKKQFLKINLFNNKAWIIKNIVFIKIIWPKQSFYE